MKKYAYKLCVLLLAIVFSANISYVFADDNFEGNGTQSEPYLIQSFDDYIKLTQLISDGEVFNGMYFKQMADIKPDNDGEYGLTSDDIFAGIYDGNGHTITISSKDSEKSFRKIKQGLFGTLSGLVINLNVEGHLVNTANAGVFAYKIIDEGKLVNCSFNGKLRSDTSGKPFFGLASTEECNKMAIINCYVNGMQSGTSNTSLKSYPITDTEGTSKYVYYNINNSETNGYAWKNSSAIDTTVGESMTAEEMSALHVRLNKNLENTAEEAGIMPEMLLVWKSAVSPLSGISTPVFTDEHWEPITIDLDGSGMIDDPYLIEDYSDYNKMASYIQKGESFEGKYFKQVKDMEVPVAGAGQEYIYGLSAGDLFAGTYDGGGHIVRLPDQHNSIAGTDIAKYGVTVLNQGLFGLLSGVVMNLSIQGRMKNVGDGGMFAYKIIDNGKLINCSFSGHVRDDLSNGKKYYGLASTSGYNGTAIINCYYYGPMAMNGTFPLYPITDTEGTSSNSYYYVTDKNNDVVGASGDGIVKTADEMTNLYTQLNDGILLGAKSAGVPPCVLYTWKSDQKMPEHSEILYSYSGIDVDTYIAVNSDLRFTAETYESTADNVKIYFDDAFTEEYNVPISVDETHIYTKEILIDKSCISAGRHNITIEVYSGGNLINKVSKYIEANTVKISNQKLTDENGEEPVFEIGNTIVFSADITNLSDTQSDVTLILAMYDKENNLIGFNFNEQKVLKTENNVEVSITVGDTADLDGSTLELYVWDSMSGLKILENETVLWCNE